MYGNDYFLSINLSKYNLIRKTHQLYDEFLVYLVSELIIIWFLQSTYCLYLLDLILFSIVAKTFSNPKDANSFFTSSLAS